MFHLESAHILLMTFFFTMHLRNSRRSVIPKSLLLGNVFNNTCFKLFFTFLQECFELFNVYITKHFTINMSTSKKYTAESRKI